MAGADEARVWRPNGPGSWRHPVGVRAVRDQHGVLWTRGATRWSCDGRTWIRWYQLVEKRGPVEEVT